MSRATRWAAIEWRWLMGLLGLGSRVPQTEAEPAGPGHKLYPYLLNGVEITRVNQVWSTDITYIRMAKGFLYLVAVMDWFSRFVLSWAVVVDSWRWTSAWRHWSARCAGDGCRDLQQRSRLPVHLPEVHRRAGPARCVAISMDGRGRCLDNIFIERLWRSLKYEEVYLRDYTRVPEARSGIGNWFRFYNHQRFHQSLDYRTPAAVFQAGHLWGTRLF